MQFMANPMKSVVKPVPQLAGLKAALEGARRASADAASSAAPAQPEVVAIARRRQFTASEKRRILAEADQCSEPGQIGALLRREGIYSSNLAAWRKRRAAEGKTGLDPRKRGNKADPVIAETRRTAALTREIDRLRRQLMQARLIIDVQKKVSSLMALQNEEDTDGNSAWTE
jgi:transposase-like protein